MPRSFAFALVSLCLALASAAAEDAPRTMLPDEHEYQRTLRAYLAPLKENDFDLGVTQPFTQPPDSADPEVQYRHWLLSMLNQPLVGSKRGAPAINAPSRLFTLAAIETPAGILQPPLWAEPAVWLANWDYAGNPYRHSIALKRRAFVVLCVLMTMLDDQIERFPERGGNRYDSLAPSVLTLAYSYVGLKETLPDNIKAAFESGLRKMGRRLLDANPQGLQPNMVVVGPVALWYVGQALADPAFTAEVEALARRVWTDEAFFHSDGYYIDRGGIDIGYAGSANIFTTWAALAADWPFAKAAIERTYRLKSLLALPDPDGRMFGPTHFNSRLGSDAPRDQWDWLVRDPAAALCTDEAAHLTTLPTPKELAAAAGHRAAVFQGQLNENAVNAAGDGFIRNEEIKSNPWQFRLWQSWSFPLAVNYASQYCPADAYARRLNLEREKSPLLVSPWEREAVFQRSIGQSFTFVKQPGYRAMLHTGEVGGDDGQPRPVPFIDFAGFGGGQLSAFWTPDTGSVILGRRGGCSREKNFDSLESWRLWPIHAVSGTTPDGKVFTSSRNRRPAVEQTGSLVRVSGDIPAAMLGQEAVLVGKASYARSFDLQPDGVRVETAIQADGQDTTAELYETIPVFLRETAQQASAVPTTIEFQVEQSWRPAGVDWSERVTAIRLTRFSGAVEIAFDTPRRVKLSPTDWFDSYMSRASCRNVLIDLLENNDQPMALREAKVAYRIAPARP